MSEQGEARRMGAKLQKNSGRGHYQKADMLLDDLSIDVKEYETSFGINKKHWAKACSDAMRNGLDYMPVIKVILGSGARKIRLAIIEWSYLEYLKDCERRLKQYEEE